MGEIRYGKQAIKVVNSSESESRSSTVTQFPVEEGAPVSDHTQFQGKTVQMTGFLLGSNAEQNYKTLSDWQDKGYLIEYRGRIYIKDIVIDNVSKTYDKIGNGFGISIAFTPIRRAKTSWTKVPNSGKKQPTPAKSTAIYVTVKRGNTYWGWWKQYGTPIQTLRNWNKWPDRFIPIGKRARVK